MSFAEKGAVGDIEPAFFIGYLHRLRATGTLKLEDAPIQRAVYLREGRVLFSSSNAPEDQLGAILVAAGKITSEAFDALVAALEPKQSIAAALAQGGHVSQRDIGDSARRKVEQIVGACCSQTSGSYEFEDGVLPKGALDLKLTTERVLIAAFEMLEPSGFLNRILKSPMAVLGASEFEPADPELVRLKGALDGASSLADIGGAVGLPLAATEARAAVLVVLGAAAVVTSQIEAMDLPDTGETLAEGIPGLQLTDQIQPIETDSPEPAADFSGSTIAFAPSSGLGHGDSTVMPSSEAGHNPYAGSSEATLVMGSGLGTKARGTSESGAIRMSGMKREKASTQDLDAVKELLGSPAPPRPTSAAIPLQSWEPVLSSGSRTGQGRGGPGAFFRSRVFRSAVAVVLLAVVAIVAWVAYSGSQARRPAASAVAVAPSLPLVAEGTPVAPNPAVSPSSVPTTQVATAAASVPTGTPWPASAAAAGTAMPAKPLPSALPVPSAAKATPPANPSVTAKMDPAIKPPGSPYDALKGGRLSEASAGFAVMAQGRAAEYSIQILVACSEQTIQKALQNDPSPDLFTLPAVISAKPCHRLMRGFFKTNSEAMQTLAILPAYYVAEGAKPKPVLVRSVLP